MICSSLRNYLIIWLKTDWKRTNNWFLINFSINRLLRRFNHPFSHQYILLSLVTQLLLIYLFSNLLLNEHLRILFFIKLYLKIFVILFQWFSNLFNWFIWQIRTFLLCWRFAALMSDVLWRFVCFLLKFRFLKLFITFQIFNLSLRTHIHCLKSLVLSILNQHSLTFQSTSIIEHTSAFVIWRPTFIARAPFSIMIKSTFD